MENNYTCIIVDDERDAIKLLSGRLALLSQQISIAGTYTSWESALSILRTHSFDILFMDISMPGKNGMDLLKLIPGLDSEIIFITAHERYIFSAFEFSTAGYLMKPVDDTELLTAIDRAIKKIEFKRQAKQTKIFNNIASPKIGIPNNKGIDYLNVSDIIYLESINKCTRVVAGRTEYISSQNLGKFKDLTDKYSFFQVHRSFIINLHSVVRYESEGIVIMPDKKEIPVSKNIRADFLRLFERIF